MDTTNFQRFVRTPFVVEAVIITEENIEEIAKLIGEVRTKGDEKYIALDRRVIPNIARAYIGWYFTKMEDNYRCYAPKLFSTLFVEVGDRDEITIKLEKTDSSV